MNPLEASEERVIRNILFVCTGNTCRSPMAEVLAREIAGSQGLDNLEIRSAGVHTDQGLTASDGARRAIQRHGLSLEDHASTVLSPDLVEWADLILAMGPGHLPPVDHAGGAEKAWLLGAFAEGVREVERRLDGPPVPDPFGGTDEVYKSTLENLRSLIEKVLSTLAEGD